MASFVKDKRKKEPRPKAELMTVGEKSEKEK